MGSNITGIVNSEVHSLAHNGPKLAEREVPYLLYADDLVVIGEDKEALQTAIDSVIEYCRESHLTINKDKTEVIVFHKGRLPKETTFHVEGVDLPLSNEVKYLGIIFTPQLTFTKHGKYIAHKANAKIGQLVGTTPIAHLPLSLVKQTFNAYILPIFFYGLILWLPRISKNTSSQINSVFTKFLKRYLRVPKHSSNDLVHFLTESIPLHDTLLGMLQMSYSSLNFPPTFTGFRPALHCDIPQSLPNYNAAKNVPTHFWLGPIPTVIPLNPSLRHHLLSELLDFNNHSIHCSNKKFHIPNPLCVCINQGW